MRVIKANPEWQAQLAKKSRISRATLKQPTRKTSLRHLRSLIRNHPCHAWSSPPATLRNPTQPYATQNTLPQNPHTPLRAPKHHTELSPITPMNTCEHSNHPVKHPCHPWSNGLYEDLTGLLTFLTPHLRACRTLNTGVEAS